MASPTVPHKKWSSAPLSKRQQERFWSLVNRATEGCWLWLGPTSNGYGIFNAYCDSWRAHRLSYELANGPIPDGLYIDHLCRTPLCVNPDHLEAVTNAENVMRGVGPCALNRQKTHCKNGHQFTPENTIVRPEWKNGRPKRQCKECKRESARRRAWRERRRAAGDV